jgi:4-hydroxybenzoate polyprenyltransferase
MIGALRMVKPRATLMLCLVAIAGALFSPTHSSPANAVLAVAVVVLVWIGTNLFNDLYDLEIDRRSNPTRVLVTGGITGLEVKALASIAYLLSALLAFLLFDWLFRVMVLTAVFLGFQYSAPPLRLRRWGPLATLSIGVGISLAFLAGGASQGGISSEGAMVAVLFGVVAFTSSSVKDFKDIEGDRGAGIRTLPIVLGYEQAVRVIALLVAASYILLVPYLLGFFEWYTAPLIPALGAANLFIIQRLADKRDQAYRRNAYTYTHLCGAGVVLVYILARVL